MKFKDLVNKVELEGVWKAFLHYYPELAERYNSYNLIFGQLRTIDQDINEEKMVIYIVKYDGCEDEYRVHGKNDGTEWSGFWDISTAKWSEWLGYEINKSVLERFSLEEIVALCLYEMTWHGYDECTIQKKFVAEEE